MKDSYLLINLLNSSELKIIEIYLAFSLVFISSNDQSFVRSLLHLNIYNFKINNLIVFFFNKISLISFDFEI